MSRTTTSTRPPDTPNDATTPTGATTPTRAPVPDGVPTAPTARALWAALLTHPDATATDLATTARIGRSTASKILTALAENGLATRVPGTQQGRTRLPDRWNATPPNPTGPATPSGQCPSAGGDSAAGRNRRDPTDVPGRATASTGPQAPGRALQRGQLRDLVAAYLRDHPDQGHTPTAIARVLDRSAGAVANACASLTARGQATRTSPHPRRYRATALLRDMP